MSNDYGYIVLKFDGPFQSWGYSSQFNVRNTAFFPTKSAISGMICASFGFDRGSKNESVLLNELNQMKFMVIDIPNKVTRFNNKVILYKRRIQDYHTVRNTITAEGELKDTHLTTRYYLSDSHYGILINGTIEQLKKIADSLKNPIWGIWFGRKSCIPSSPVFRGGPILDKTEALHLLIGETPIEEFQYEEDTDDFNLTIDTKNDMALSFYELGRKFIPRRVKRNF